MLGERVMNELFNKSPRRIMLEATPHVIILVQAGEEALILTIALKRSIGITLLTIDRMARKVESLISSTFG
jgi:predicted regulator of Ras-like GTPase activity (Roadblock/LC7/MglB family)